MARTHHEGGGSAASAVNRSLMRPGPALILPLTDIGSSASSYSNVLVILHAYHLDVAERMIHRLASLNAAGPTIPMRLVATTDSQGKANKIGRMISKWSSSAPIGHVIEIHPNRGRNVAPFLAACRTHARGDDLILHLHTKKSPHASELLGWGEYLFDCLAGSREVIESIFAIFRNSQVGLLYPGHYRSILNIVEWGSNFAVTRGLLQTLDLNITHDTPLDFPSGMMFWARLAALKPLLDMNLSHSDFEIEAGQIDGTLAHALERAMIYTIERSNYVAQQVVWDQRINDFWGVSTHATIDEVPGIFCRNRLLDGRT